MMKRDNCFDFLRFVLAFNVVLGHLTVVARFPELNRYSFLFNTYLSVTGFFVISGYLIAQSYERSATLKSYFIKRAKRLLPAYIFVVLGCAIGLVGLSSLPITEYYSSIEWWKYIGANLSFMNFLHPWLPGVFNSSLINDNCVNPSLWTLKIEVGFYLIIPLLMLWFRKSVHPWAWFMVIYILAVIYRNGLAIIANIYEKDLFHFLARQLPGFMSYFATGIVAYLYKDYFLRYKNQILALAVMFFTIEHFLDIEIFTPLAWGIIILWCAYSLPRLNNFAKYGDISYGIYIYHGPILKILLTLGLFTHIGVWPATIVYIACIVLTGQASWHALENLFLRRQ